MADKIDRVFLVGFMGSGKTTSGKRLAQKYGFQFIDLDNYIEERNHKTISQIFADEGEDGFRKIERKMLHEVILFNNVIVACGGGTPCFFDNMDVMNDAGVTIYLKASPENLATYLRQNGTSKRPLVKDKTPEELVEYIRATLDVREPYYEKAQYTIASDDFSDVLYDTLFL